MEELNDEIGRCNREICRLEHDIPELEDMLASKMLDEEIENRIAVQQSLHECRMKLESCRDRVLSCRRTLIGRLEIEQERVEKELATAHPNWNEGEQRLYEIKRDLDTLRKITEL